MKFKVLVILSGFLVLTTLAVCVSVHAYNAWASGSRNAEAGTISMSAGANGHGLISGKTRATVKADNRVERQQKDIAPGKKDNVSKSLGGADNLSGDASGYVHGWDVHGWEHKRTHDVRYSPISKTFSDKTTHTIKPPP